MRVKIKFTTQQTDLTFKATIERDSRSNTCI